VSHSYRVFAALAFALGALALDGCFAPVTIPVERAMTEFKCARQNINVIERDDVGRDVFDVEACGRHARYHCIFANTAMSCAREPDPPTWSPDPASFSALMQPAGAPATDYRVAHICDIPRGGDCDCFAPNAESWHFYACKKPTAEGVRSEPQPVGAI
jgi:hypothetical protein